MRVFILFVSFILLFLFISCSTVCEIPNETVFNKDLSYLKENVDKWTIFKNQLSPDYFTCREIVIDKLEAFSNAMKMKDKNFIYESFINTINPYLENIVVNDIDKGTEDLISVIINLIILIRDTACEIYSECKIYSISLLVDKL